MVKGLVGMVVAAGVMAAGAAGAAPLGKGPVPLVVLGDSLSDIGNAGRFSDGPVWVEVLAQRLGSKLVASTRGGNNHAVGGARIQGGAHSLRVQADRYLDGLGPGGKVPANALLVVYGGGNDLLAAPWAPNRATLVPDAVATLRGILEDLAKRGATNVLVPNLPDIGLAPQVKAFGPQVVAIANALSESYNAALSRMLDGVEARHPTLRVHRLDVHALAREVMADPGAFGFRDVSGPCPDRRSCVGYLFWDGLHPTSAAHAKLADAALRAIPGAADRVSVAR